MDGVLLIAEHGDYPYNAKGQKLYPRYEFFQKIVGRFRKSGRSVPVFCDKHLSYDRKKAAEMVATAQEMRFPLMAGSSPAGDVAAAGTGIAARHEVEGSVLVVSRRTGNLRHPRARSAAVHGRAAFHEPPRRQQGVKAVTCLQGDAVWKAGDDGLWSWELLEHALGRSPSRNVGDVRANCRHFQRPTTWGNFVPGPIAFLIEYRDGLQGDRAATRRPRRRRDVRGADRRRDEAGIDAVLAAAAARGRVPGSAGVHVEKFLATGQAAVPRRAHAADRRHPRLRPGIARAEATRLETPDLDIRYDAAEDSGFMRGDYAKPVK